MHHGTDQERPRGGRSLTTILLVVLLAAGSVAMVAGVRLAAAADFSIGDTAVVDSEELNIRAEPTLDGEIVTVATAGAVGAVLDGPVTADDYNWYQIELEDGTTGWAAGDLMSLLGAIDPGLTPGAAAVVAYGPLNLRADASLAADTVTTMDPGTVVTVVSGPVTADGLPWYELDAGELGAGWAAGGFLGFSDETPPTNVATTISIGAVVAVDADGLNLRDDATLAGGVIDILPFGARATVLDGPIAADDFNWYQLETALGTGWSAGDFLVDPASLIAVGDTVQVADGDLNVRADATLDADVLDVLPVGAELSVADGPIDADGYTWFAVTSSDFGAGWVAGQFLAVVGSTETVETESEEPAADEATAAETVEADEPDADATPEATEDEE
ncbi:MAG: SH3 domain-containing protein [Thermomicrobiales bacterium]